ncbi:hypothetical protein MTR67_026345 [Solanum verrucosum]|uniref:Spen paralogue and orthologue SPOC C-terminal domain-containing protein n=1 Tax=Solanum verrucosum TaxID=315347 RepID=A0AAF0R237_SOLVR|nr:hypothetical protein MTR67_026345 [Solanum verrucosum]
MTIYGVALLSRIENLCVMLFVFLSGPDVLNLSLGMGLYNLAKYYSDAIVGFYIVFFYPNTNKDFASYAKFSRYLSSKDLVGVEKLDGGTNMFLVPPLDFIKKVLKVDGPTCFYLMVLKSTPHTPSGKSLPLESYQPRYVDAPEITSSKVSQVRSFLTNDLITSLSKFQPSSSVEGTTGFLYQMLLLRQSVGDMLIDNFA